LTPTSLPKSLMETERVIVNERVAISDPLPIQLVELIRINDYEPSLLKLLQIVQVEVAISRPSRAGEKNGRLRLRPKKDRGHSHSQN